MREPSAVVEHEASTGKIGEDQLFYFQQRVQAHTPTYVVLDDGALPDGLNEWLVNESLELRLTSLQRSRINKTAIKFIHHDGERQNQ